MFNIFHKILSRNNIHIHKQYIKIIPSSKETKRRLDLNMIFGWASILGFLGSLTVVILSLMKAVNDPNSGPFITVIYVLAISLGGLAIFSLYTTSTLNSKLKESQIIEANSDYLYSEWTKANILLQHEAECSHNLNHCTRNLLMLLDDLLA